MRSQSLLSSVVGNGLAVDLGTANTVIYAEGHGIVLDEPSVVAVGRADGRVVAVGTEAKRMLGRTPRHIETVRPLQDGVVSDFDLCEQMLRYFVGKVQSRRWTRPRMVICVPSGVTGVEQRSVQEAAESAGARKPVGIIEEPLAAAIGAGLPIHEPNGNMIVDIGGGTTEVAVISLGGIVADASVRIGGDEFDDAIRDFTKREYSLAIGERTAEEVKQKLASAWPLREEFYAEIRGSDLGSGLPKTATVSTTEVREAIEVPLNAVIDAVKAALDRTPPELAADLMERGIMITGGGSLLHGLDRALEAETQMPIRKAAEPLYSVVLGSARALGA
jgi:rod shape-determining protein MreB